METGLSGVRPVSLSAVRFELVLIIRDRQWKRNWPTAAYVSTHSHPLVFLLLYGKRFVLFPTNKENVEINIKPHI